MAQSSTIHSYKVEAPQSPTPLSSLTNDSPKSKIIEAINFVAVNMGLDKTQFYKTIECESSLNASAVGDGGFAYGILQFHPDTFKQYCTGEYHSVKDQLRCAAKLWQHGYQRLWTCWSKYFGS